MGLFSLFSSRKGDDPASARTRRSRGGDAGAGIGAARGGRRTADDYADDTLDPEFPQKQRARRRLIGAVVLTVAAVIVLPILFETEPRPASDNIAVRLASGQPDKPRPEPRKADPVPPQGQNAPRAEAQSLDAGEELVSLPSARAAEKDDGKSDAAPARAEKAEKASERAEKASDKADARTGTGKYVILVGAFSTEDKARNWLAKLKASKVPAYIERKNMADGERILLRAGPFGDRDAAEAAEKRVRAAGLTARVVEL